MRRITVALMIGLMASACSPVPFKISSAPANKTPEQKSLDNLECNKSSEVQGPWLFGIGTLAYRRMAASGYEKCMNARGYKVEEQ
jgi:hypothetical protein